MLSACLAGVVISCRTQSPLEEQLEARILSLGDLLCRVSISGRADSLIMARSIPDVVVIGTDTASTLGRMAPRFKQHGYRLDVLEGDRLEDKNPKVTHSLLLIVGNGGLPETEQPVDGIGIRLMYDAEIDKFHVLGNSVPGEWSEYGASPSPPIDMVPPKLPKWLSD